jgi:hypothetical protein
VKDVVLHLLFDAHHRLFDAQCSHKKGYIMLSLLRQHFSCTDSPISRTALAIWERKERADDCVMRVMS